VKTVIIGGGISGLTAAYDLARAGREAVLIDSQAALGGVMQTRAVAGCVVEAGPDSFLSSKPAALQLLRELGLDGEVIGSNDHQRVTYIWRDGRLVAMPDGLMMMVPTKLWPMAWTPLLGWGTKVRMGLEYFRGPRECEERSVAALVREHYGQEVVDYLAEPLLAGVYGGDPEKLSAASVLPRFVDLEKRFGSLTRGALTERRKAPAAPAGGTLFRTLKRGLGSWVEALERAIAPHVTVVRDRVLAVEPGYRVKLAGGVMDADRVIVAAPAWSAAELLAGFDGELAGELRAVDYSSSMTVGLVYDERTLGHELKGFGFLVPKREREFLLACTWVHRKFAHRAEPGRALLRAFAPDAALSDDEAVARTRADLRRLMGVTAEPVAVSVSRWPRSMAQYEVGHAARVARIEARAAGHAGLHLIGNAYRGIGIPDCIQLARDTIKRIL